MGAFRKRDLLQLVKPKTYQVTTGCPLLFWTLCFLPFIGFQSTYNKIFSHFRKAHKILISKMSKVIVDTLYRDTRADPNKVHGQLWSFIGVKSFRFPYKKKHYLQLFFVGIFLQDPPSNTRVFPISGMIFKLKMRYPLPLIQGQFHYLVGNFFRWLP